MIRVRENLFGGGNDRANRDRENDEDQNRYRRNNDNEFIEPMEEDEIPEEDMGEFERAINYYGPNVPVDQFEDENPISEDNGYLSSSSIESEMDKRVVPRPNAMAMSIATRVCAIRSYYENRLGYRTCTGCYLENPEIYGQVVGCWNHETGIYIDLCDRWCNNCGKSMTIFIAYNACRVCINGLFFLSLLQLILN